MVAKSDEGFGAVFECPLLRYLRSERAQYVVVSGSATSDTFDAARLIPYLSARAGFPSSSLDPDVGLATCGPRAAQVIGEPPLGPPCPRWCSSGDASRTCCPAMTKLRSSRPMLDGGAVPHAAAVGPACPRLRRHRRRGWRGSAGLLRALARPIRDRGRGVLRRPRPRRVADPLLGGRRWAGPAGGRGRLVTSVGGRHCETKRSWSSADISNVVSGPKAARPTCGHTERVVRTPRRARTPS